MKKLLLIVLVIIFLPSLLWGANVTILTELRQDVKNNLLVMGDALYPDSVLDDFINEACRDLAGHGIIEHVDSIVWVANTRFYDLPIDFIHYKASYPDAVKDKKALDFIASSSMGKIGGSFAISKYIWITGEDFVKDTTATIWFYPPPTAVDTVILVYTAEAVELSAATDTTNIPYAYCPLIGHYATAKCFAKAQKYNEATWWFTLYDQMLTKKIANDERWKKFDYFIQPRVIKKP